MLSANALVRLIRLQQITQGTVKDDEGIEHRIGTRGVVGLNAFYRSISDLIEDTNTGRTGSAGAGTFVYTVDNVGDGEVYGVEFDLSTPLDFIGMDTTGVFFNAS